jgi:hypothetical protein
LNSHWPESPHPRRRDVVVVGGVGYCCYCTSQNDGKPHQVTERTRVLVVVVMVMVVMVIVVEEAILLLLVLLVLFASWRRLAKY